jgi:hypothetical protein
VSRKQRPIEEFLRYPPRDLSLKAIAGFERRFSSSTLRAPDEFRQALRSRIEQLSLASG